MSTHRGGPGDAVPTLTAAARVAGGQCGFSLAEVLVAVLVLGILAAVGVPSFLNQKSKGSDAEAKSTAVAATKAMESCATRHSGDYRSCSKDELIATDPALEDARGRLAVTVGLGTYQIVVESRRDRAVSFTVSRAANGTVSRTCVTGDDAGGCIMSKTGTW
jgi:type IV pilus assembly protein PilA